MKRNVSLGCIPIEANFFCTSKRMNREQSKRIIKDRGAIVLTASQPFTSALVMSNPKMFKYEWIWNKCNPTNFALANKQPLKYHENVLVFSKKQSIYNPIKWQGILQVEMCQKHRTGGLDESICITNK